MFFVHDFTSATIFFHMFNILHMYILYCLDIRKANESLFVMYYSVIPETKPV